METQRFEGYRIEGRIGEGGMGEVFRAWDEDLDRSVAIKRIRTDKSFGERGRERFRREAKAAARLSHPAIVQIHRILFHNDGDAIVMELVEGETLSALIRQGPLPLATALPLLREIADALASAHAQGTIHRDLKTDNVMVTTEGRPKILDFGLAKQIDHSQSSLTEDGRILGTLHTMAPEQAQGARVDARTDLFAFGVLVYEVLTGQSPFRGTTARETISRVLIHRPPPARTKNPEVSEELSEWVDLLLEKDPARRPKNAAGVVATLDRLLGRASVPIASLSTRTVDPEPSGDVIPTIDASTIAPPSVKRPTPSSATQPRQRRRAFGAAALLILAVILAGYLVLRLWAPDTAPSSPPEAPAIVARPSVAVLSFDNRGGRGEAQWLSLALAERLRFYLATGDEVRVVRGERVTKVERDLDPVPLGRLGPEERDRLRDNLAVDVLVSGFYETDGEGASQLLRIAVQLEDPASGEVRQLDAKSGVIARLATLVREAGEPVRQELGAATPAPGLWLAAKASFPTAPKTARLYALGLDRLWHDEDVEARELLARASEEAPEDPLPYVFLAVAWMGLGNFDEALEAAEKALSMAGDLPPTLRSKIETLQYQAAGDEERALALLRERFETFPDDLEAGLALGQAERKAERADAALVTLDQIARIPAAAGDPRLAFQRASAWEILGEREKARDFAAQAAREAERRGARLLAAEASCTEALARLDLGEIDAAVAVIDASIRRLRTGEYPLALAEAYETKAIVVYQQGDLSGAGDLYESALTIYLRQGNRRRAARIQSSLGSLRRAQGRLDEAKTLFEEALPAFHQVDDFNEAIVLLNLGIVHHQKGNLSSARERYVEALPLFQDEGYVGLALSSIAEIFFLEGDLVSARERHEEAVTRHRKSGRATGVAYDTYRLGRVFAAQGDYVVARQRYAAALKEQERLGETAKTAETRLALAELSLLEGDAATAEKLAAASEEVLRVAGQDDKAALAAAVLARSLQTQGRLGEAARFSERAIARAGESSDLHIRIAAVLADASLAVAQGDDVEAQLARVLVAGAEAEAAGFILDGFEARLVAGEIELAAGRVEDAHTRLEELRREADAKGVRGIARQVEAIR